MKQATNLIRKQLPINDTSKLLKKDMNLEGNCWKDIGGVGNMEDRYDHM